MNKIKLIYPLVIVFSLFFLASGGAQVKKSTGKVEDKKSSGKADEKKAKTDQQGFGFSSSRSPIDISSDTMEADQKQNTVTFKGNVVAKQEETTLYSNTLTITYDPDTKKLKLIVAVGNVKVVQLEKRATGRVVTFDQDKNNIVLTGDAVLRDRENVIRGEKITFYVEEERSVVEGGKGGRVNTHITPPPKEQEEPKK
jgi:lipopolysaccharide export system protein LptA